MNKYINVFLHPKKFLKKLISLNVEHRLKTVLKKELSIPINKFSEKDIFIVGYPKSGNTWMQTLATGLLYDVNTEFLSDKLAQEIVPDVHARLYYRRYGEINFFKSHHLPQKAYRRVIYIVRDGRDAITSYFFYNKLYNSSYSLEDTVKYKLELFPSKWHEHVKQWLSNPYKSDIIYIRYEDLLNNPETELKKLCRFIGIKRDDSVIKRVIKGSTIDKMQEKAKKFGGMGHAGLLGEKGVKFFRKGKIGDYKNYFSPELLSYFNQEAEKELKHFKYL